MRAVEPQEELQEEASAASTTSEEAGATETDQSTRTTTAINPLLRLIARWLMVALALYIIGSMLWSTRPVLIPFVIGLVLAYLMAPAVDFFDRWMPRWLAILAVYTLGLLGIAATFALIIPPLVEQVARLIRQLPSFSEVQMFVDSVVKQYRDQVPPSLQQPIEDSLANLLRSLQNNIDTYLQRGGAFLLNQLIQLLNTVTFILGFISLPIWLFYVLYDKHQGRVFFNQLVHPRARADFWNVWEIINNVLGGYIRGQIILCVAVGLAVGIGLVGLEMLGFPLGDYVLVLALIAGVTEFIPVLGPTIGAIPGVILGFGISPTAGFAVLILYIAVQQLENSLLVPRIIGESVGVHPAVLTVAMIVMGTLFGLLGILLAAPAVATTRDLFKYAYLRLEGHSPEESHRRVAERHAPIIPQLPVK
ncbi:MAG: AI-2E family transporter [Roseiflexus sp.]|uniref:AI-2E family transporter n=1 Tax=Roseiflexus sp. TaxID=2562120 RepID=UPI0025E49559|nr:AI-2E family transporter [Roseiflexus sp.]MCL6540523.1 AI-2E family transporter [Roseiflexus sp.]